MDYSFFAMLFAVATALAPEGAHEVSLQNMRHPEQSLVWTRGDDGRWAMQMNTRDAGHFERRGEVIVHHTGVDAPRRYPLAELLDTRGLGRRTDHVDLRGTFAPTVLRVERSGGAIELVDPTRALLMTRLRLHHR